MPETTTQKERSYYKNECLRKAKKVFCKEAKYLNIGNRDVRCDKVQKRYRKYCEEDEDGNDNGVKQYNMY